MIKYLVEAKEELAKVTWPSRRDIVRYSLVIIAVSLVFAAYFGALDAALSAGLKWLIGTTN
jgi:preprotein translocase subunit SecE